MAMSCNRVRVSLGEYVAQDLSTPERIGVEEHLSFCAACEMQASLYRAIIHRIRSLATHTRRTAESRSHGSACKN